MNLQGHCRLCASQASQQGEHELTCEAVTLLHRLNSVSGIFRVWGPPTIHTFHFRVSPRLLNLEMPMMSSCFMSLALPSRFWTQHQLTLEGQTSRSTLFVGCAPVGFRGITLQILPSGLRTAEDEAPAMCDTLPPSPRSQGICITHSLLLFIWTYWQTYKITWPINNMDTCTHTNSYLTTSSMLFLYTPSSRSAGKPIAIMFG